MTDPRPILLVEDDLDSLNALSDALGDGGFAVLATADGAEAMRHLREGRPRLVLLDLKMPRMDGWEFATFKNMDPALAGIPLVLLSGASDLSGHAERLRAAAFVRKPCTSERLVDVVKSVLESSPDR